MSDFIFNGILWTLALYGLIEIIRTIMSSLTYRNLKSNGIYLIIAVKNVEEIVEGFLRSFIFRVMYGKEDFIKDIIIADLNSTDSTAQILEKMRKRY